jgi:uncharacterized membrane protein YfcA
MLVLYFLGILFFWWLIARMPWPKAEPVPARRPTPWREYLPILYGVGFIPAIFGIGWLLSVIFAH